MKSQKFTALAQLLDQIETEDPRQKFVGLMWQVFEELRSNFSVSSLLLYQELLDRAKAAYPDIELPSFYQDEFLDESFRTDPSDFAIVYGLAMKNISNGNLKRARQLLTRIATSGYKQRDLARTQLDQIPPLPH
jgi:thioredoxin-like negative regulator of GroEL